MKKSPLHLIGSEKREGEDGRNESKERVGEILKKGASSAWSREMPLRGLEAA